MYRLNSHQRKANYNSKSFKLALTFVRSETIADNEEGRASRLYRDEPACVMLMEVWECEVKGKNAKKRMEKVVFSLKKN